MKKILLFGTSTLLLAGIMSACSGKGEAQKEKEDSIRTADSLAVVKLDLEQARQDSIIQDSIIQATAIEKYKDAVTITPGNKDKKHVPETSFYKINWTCTLTNNSGIVMHPGDYQVTFDETFEDGNADGLFDVTKQRTLKGVVLAPDSTAQVVLTGRANTQELSNPGIKMLISEEEFISRYKQAFMK